MDISANIKAIRQAKGIAQAEVARRLETDSSSYHRLESRGSKMTIHQAESIASALDVSLLDLLTWGTHTPDTDTINDAGPLRERVAELEGQVTDKTKIERYQDRHIRRVELWLCNYFRYEVWKVAVKLGMLKEGINYMTVSDYYKEWGQAGISRIVNEGLVNNPFVYQMLYRSIYIDDALFIEPINDYTLTDDVQAFQKRAGQIDWSDVMPGQADG